MEDKSKTKKSQTKMAVALAMERRWEEAAGVNRAIIEDFPDELEAYNRLGKALSELGQNGEASEASAGEDRISFCCRMLMFAAASICDKERPESDVAVEIVSAALACPCCDP